jgi:hypothetical protein
LGPESTHEVKGAVHSDDPAQLQLRFCSHPDGIGSQAYWIDGPTGAMATQIVVKGSQVRPPPQSVGSAVKVVRQVLAMHSTIAGPRFAWIVPSSARVDWVGHPHSGNCELHSPAAVAKRFASD